MRFDELPKTNVTIWGAGREGLAAHRELAARGIEPIFALTGDAAQPTPGELPAVAVTGEQALERLLGSAAVVKSPGVPHTAAEYQALKRAGVPITSLMDLWLSDHGAQVIAVTGTKGKSTTSSLVHHLLGALGIDSVLAGNIGTPVSSGGGGTRIAVTEVSSYQAAELSSSPRIAVLTSLYPEHLPWHGGYDAYVNDKFNLIAHGTEVVVVPSLESEVADRARALVGAGTALVSPSQLGICVEDQRLLWQGVGVLHTDDLSLRGTHNLMNAALALTAVNALHQLSDAQRALAFESLRDFAPLAHRLEQVPSNDGRSWIDDGLATAPQAVMAALDAYAGRPVTLLAGGAERDLPFDELVDYLVSRPSGAEVDVVTTGPAGRRLAAALAERGSLSAVTVHDGARNFAAALETARLVTPSGGVVLLSPGAPSFDEFADYEARSAAFREGALSR